MYEKIQSKPVRNVHERICENKQKQTCPQNILIQYIYK